MSPRGKAKAKTEADENGRRVRESRNVKATSYKDLSDSEDDKPLRKKKKESESESMSEDEKPKKKVVKGRRAPARSRKEESESDEASEISEASSDEDNSKRRKSSRKPARSLRAPQRASYKDLSNSEEDSDEEDEESRSTSENEEKSPSSGKRKRGRPPKSEKKEGSEEEEEEEEDSNNEEDAGNTKLAHNPDSADTSSAAKVKGESAKKEESDGKVEKKARPEHEMSEEEEDEEEGESEDDEHQDKKAGKKGGSDSKKRGRLTTKSEDVANDDKEVDEPLVKKAKVSEKPVMNKTDTDYSSLNFSSEAKTKSGELWNFKISSWNVAGLKAIIKKNGLDYIKHENPDILCLQETKCSEKKVPPEAKVEGYHTYWLSGEKDGYAGVAILSKTKPLNVKYGVGKPELDSEGRVITAEYDKFFLVNVYVPNAGQGLKTLPKRLDWDPTFQAYLKKLDEEKPVILCGDMNVAHSEIDLTNPKTNVKNAGFTPQEREGMTNLLKEGFVDTFRNLYPEKTGAYSFWSYFNNARARNIGWRLDYFITSERLLPQVCDNVMRNDVYGSDHCPITLFLHV